MEIVIQKSTEIGVDRIIPVISARVITDKRDISGKTSRWQKISDGASKQSKRDYKCEVFPPEEIRNIKVSDYDLEKINFLKKEFQRKAATDLNWPEALAVVWQMAKSNLPPNDKLELIRDFDEVLGLGLIKKAQVKFEIPKEIEKMKKERENLRKANQWQKADELRKKIEIKGFILEDTPQGVVIKKKK